jgi:hypothetical protein
VPDPRNRYFESDEAFQSWLNHLFETNLDPDTGKERSHARVGRDAGGLSGQYISALRNGDRGQPPIDTVDRIAEAFGLPGVVRLAMRARGLRTQAGLDYVEAAITHALQMEQQLTENSADHGDTPTQ